jgi:hypothetical protein
MWKELKPIALKKSGNPPQQSNLNRYISQGKEHINFGPFDQHKGQTRCTTPKKGGYLRRKPLDVGIKGGDIKNKRCHICDNFGHFQAAFPQKHCECQGKL